MRVSHSESLPRIAHGRGSYLWDREGRRYLDGSGGPAVYCLGHAHPEVNAHVIAQLDRIASAYRYHFTSDPLDRLTALIAEATGGLFADAVYVTSGSEAVESCLKLALQYHAARGDRHRIRFVARRRSWHGNTLGALGVSDFAARRAPFAGAVIEPIRVSAANAYRPPEGVAPANLVAHLAAELDAAIRAAGPETVAAFVFEPVVGAAQGVVPAPPGYAQAVTEVCRRHGVLVIADEVMCGAGRCGTWRALEHDGAVPDLMSVAKGLAGGYLPLGAALMSGAVAAVIAGDGGPLTGHTFTGHTAACAAGVAVQTIIRRDGLLARMQARGPALIAALRAALSDVPEVGDIRGRGYFIGLELVADPATKAPFPAAASLAPDIGRRARAAGLICYPCTGHVDGTAGDTVILAPPYNASDAELDEIVALLAPAVRAAVAAARSPA